METLKSFTLDYECWGITGRGGFFGLMIIKLNLIDNCFLTPYFYIFKNGGVFIFILAWRWSFLIQFDAFYL